MARERKFNFSEILFEKPKPKKEFVSIYKSGSMVIPQSVLQNHGLDGKMIKFIYDEQKKVLGFRKVEGNIHGQYSKSMKPVKQVNGRAIVAVGKILKHAGLEKKTYGQLALGVYKDQSLIENGEVYYVKLK